MPEVLIATLGSESQVVTLSLLKLERLGFEVGEVAVIHTNDSIHNHNPVLMTYDPF